MVSTPALQLIGCSVLVTAVAVSITVSKSLTEVLPVELPVAIARIVVFGSVLKVAFVAILKALTALTILATFLNAVVVAGVQRRLRS